MMIWITIVISVFSGLFILLSALLFDKVQRVKQFKLANKLLLASWIFNIATFLFIDLLQSQMYIPFWLIRILVLITSSGSLLLLSLAVYFVVLSYIKDNDETRG